MTGLGILRGMWVTFRRFLGTFLDDFRWGTKRYKSKESLDMRRSSKARGIFTIQYPEEKAPLPEEFRFVPFLVYDEGPNGEKQLRCTSCGICAKVCPPQCIWVVRTTDPTTGRPVPAPAEFYIDIDICMNCGSCAEFCPFDAIKMDHNYEIASYNRKTDNILGKDILAKPASYYKSIRPSNYAREEQAKAEKAAMAKQKANVEAT